MAKSIDDVGITFANIVMARGVALGVANVTLGAFLFTPDDKGTKVDPDPAVVCRLRMDEICARRLHTALAEILEIYAKQRAIAVSEAIANSGTEHDTESKGLN